MPIQANDRGEGIRTNGIGKRFTGHLNLTRSLADPPPESEAMERAKYRAALRVGLEEQGQLKRHERTPRRQYAGMEE